MTFTQSLYSLTLLGVWDAGVADKERIVMRVVDPVSLGFFAVSTGLRGSEHTNLFPYRDRVFWFPDRAVKPSDWIILYTGKGTPQETQLNNTSQTAYTYHWGLEETIFIFSDIVPILVQIGGVLAAPNNPGKPLLMPLIQATPSLEPPK